MSDPQPDDLGLAFEAEGDEPPDETQGVVKQLREGGWSPEGDQLVQEVPRLEVIPGVLALIRLHDGDLGSHVPDGRLHFTRMAHACRVSVSYDPHPRAPQEFGVLGAPLSGAPRGTGGDTAGLFDRVDVLLSFDHEDQLPGGGGPDDLGEAVEDSTDSVEVEGVAITRGPALTEVLRFEAHDLEQEGSGLVDIWVDVSNGPSGRHVRSPSL
jgi:hypothetical protein